jgi:hypothetical protein
LREVVPDLRNRVVELEAAVARLLRPKWGALVRLADRVE